MNRQVVRFLVLAVLSFVVMSAGSLSAAPFYAGKTLRIVVGSRPGGGYDRMSRLLAKHLPAFLPGKPTIIVENNPGAASMIAANNMYNLEKPDGLTIGCFNQGLPFAQLLKSPGVRFDITKFAWIGSAAREASLFTVRSDLPYRSVNDLRKVTEPIPLGSSGPENQNYQFPALLKEFAGFNFKLITYPSATEALLSLERKETDGQAGTYSSLTPYLKRGLIRPLIRGRITAPGIENLPVDEDLTTDKRGKTIMALRSAADTNARPYVAPPKTSPEIMKMLRDAFARVTKDRAFLSEAEQNSVAIQFTPAEESLKVVKFILSQPDDVARDFGKFIKF